MSTTGDVGRGLFLDGGHPLVRRRLAASFLQSAGRGIFFVGGSGGVNPLRNSAGRGIFFGAGDAGARSLLKSDERDVLFGGGGGGSLGGRTCGFRSRGSLTVSSRVKSSGGIETSPFCSHASGGDDVP